MTYTSSDDGTTHYNFFVVGGNSDGTEDGRIYLHRERSGTHYLWSYSHDPSHFVKWNASSWTSDTMIVLDDTSILDVAIYPFDGIANLPAAVSLGVGGNVLFDGVDLP